MYDNDDVTSIEGAVCPLRDPRRIFEDLKSARLTGVLPHSQTFDSYLVTEYDDIVMALHDPTTFSSAVTVVRTPEPWRTQWEGRVPTRGTLLGTDNPDHDRLRSAMNTFFVPRRLKRFEPWIREQAHRMVDEFVADGRADLKQAFGLPLALRVITGIVGLGSERAEEVGRALGFIQGDRDIYHAGEIEGKAALYLQLHEDIRELMEQRRIKREDDLISHIWNERENGVEMDDLEMLSLFPGLMLAGHETSSNLICMSVAHLLTDRSRWDLAQQDDQHRARALEEMFRFESAITGMKRLVTKDTTLGSRDLKAGDKVFLAYAAGSRDPSKFEYPDTIDFERSTQTAHLGFGQGMHACLGAPLARILLRIELEVLGERLPDLQLGVSPDELENTIVSEGRGLVGLPITWTAQPPRGTQRDVAARPLTIDCTVRSLRMVADEVMELDLQFGGDAPRCDPGAHVDVHLPNGVVRQYSIMGADSSSLRVAVLREQTSRGSSAYIHERLGVGDHLSVGAPRNHFPLKPAAFYVFIAGGIGITPLLPMIAAAERDRIGWRLVYLGSKRSRMAYADQLEREYPGKVYVWPSDERGRFALATIWERVPVSDSLVYACGPERLMSAMEESAAANGFAERLILERFAPRSAAYLPNSEFEVELARSGRVLRVPKDRSILQVVNEAGASVLSTCQEGTCGTCEVRVLFGTPEHRDSVLDARERLANDTTMVCVSRSLGNKLVLDL